MRNVIRISLKVNLVLWNNGGPPIIAANQVLAEEDNADFDSEDSDGDVEESANPIPDRSFNQLLVNMDVAAKKLAEHLAINT